MDQAKLNPLNPKKIPNANKINGFNPIRGLYTGRMEVIRFDFDGSSGEMRHTSQGFLRVNARLTKAGIFSYENGREYRSPDEVFRESSLESLKGAPVTDLHPSEKSVDSFLTPANARQWAVPELVDSNSLLDKPFLKFYWW